MTEPQVVSYQTQTVKCVRGLETRTAAKWESQGWEVVDQSTKAMYTELTLRRPKPKTKWWPLAVLGGVIVVLAIMLTVIRLFGGSGSTPQAETTPSTTLSQVAEPSSPTNASNTTIDASPKSTDPDTGQSEFAFNQEAYHTQKDRTGEDIPLQVVVKPPVTFKPSRKATVFDHRSAVGGYKGKLFAATIYFEVTIKNLSPTDTWARRDFPFSDVNPLNDLYDEVSTVHDGDVEGGFNFDGLKPGASFTYKDGFSVPSAENIVYELKFDGLAGRTLYFTNR